MCNLREGQTRKKGALHLRLNRCDTIIITTKQSAKMRLCRKILCMDNECTEDGVGRGKEMVQTFFINPFQIIIYTIVQNQRDL